MHTIEQNKPGKSHHEQATRTRGFTLVEMAIVILILGIIFSMFAQAYRLYLKNLRIETTQVNVESVAAAIGAYRAVHGAYPCPAPLSADPSSPAYGHPVANCAATATVAGDCAPNAATPDYCVQQSIRTVDIDPGPGVTNINPLVLRGAVPFRALNLQEDQAYDGYGSKIVYAVTARQTDPANFTIDQGGIEITGDSGASAITPAGSAHFLVLSPGENANGGFTAAGGRQPCDMARPELAGERENCETANADAVYNELRHSTSNTGTYFDDVITYFTQSEMPLWQMATDPLHQLDIHTKPGGNVGFATNLGDTLDATGRVNGDARARDDMITNQLCQHDGAGCFEPELIGGQLGTTGGMDKSDPATADTNCGPGAFVIGVGDKEFKCSDDVQVTCPAGQYMAGVNADGSLNCMNPPLRDCAADSKEVCPGEFRTLALSPHGTRLWTSPVAGATRAQRWQCNDGTWQYLTASGACVCTPQAPQTRDIACAAGFSGTITQQRTYTCPAGTWTAWVDTVNNCVCQDITNTRTLACPTGFSGAILQENVHSCSPAPAWSGWATVSNTCTCVPATETRTLSCSGGLTGQIDQERDFQCPSGTWTGWNTVNDTCTCVPKSETRAVACPAGYTGSIVEERNLSCPGATWGPWAEVSNSCVEVPPKVCTWTTTGSASGAATSFGIGPPAGSVCACGTAAGACHVKVGPTSNLNYTHCECQ